MSDFISVGKILNFHGINGELKVGYTKGKEEQLKTFQEVYLLISDEYKKFNVSNIRFHKQFAIIKLKEFNNINEVLEYKGRSLFVPKENVTDNLDTDEYLIDDLIGLDVVNQDNKKVGTVKEIEENAAGNLLAITTTNKKNCLVPFVKNFITKVDTKNKLIVINEIEGLIE